jgi:hypothetical protein
MVIVFSGNRRPSKKREKLRMVNGEGIFRYSAAVVRDLSACPHRQKNTKTPFSVNGYLLFIMFFSVFSVVNRLF